MNDMQPGDLGAALLHAARQLETRMEEGAAEAGLSVAKLGVLTKLVEHGESLSLGELAALSSCVRSNMTQLVDRLESDGLVRRVDDPEDRRSVRAELTELGRQRQREGAARVAHVQAQFLAGLDPSDRSVMGRLLSGLP